MITKRACVLMNDWGTTILDQTSHIFGTAAVNCPDREQEQTSSLLRVHDVPYELESILLSTLAHSMNAADIGTMLKPNQAFRNVFCHVFNPLFCTLLLLTVLMIRICVNTQWFFFNELHGEAEELMHLSS